jgi:3-oxoacyl-(acyl-carrier-protein) synthase
VFAPNPRTVAISGTKALHGHALGASGAEELAITVLALQAGHLPPTVNLEHPDETCDLDLILGTARRQPVAYAMANSFGFGGINSAVVIGRVD